MSGFAIFHDFVLQHRQGWGYGKVLIGEKKLKAAWIFNFNFIN